MNFYKIFSFPPPCHPYKNRSPFPITPPRFAPFYRTSSPLIAVLKVLPWQMKSIFIIVLFLLVLPRNALFCKIFWNSCSLLWNYRLWQIRARLSKLVLPVSSKIGSNTSKSYYLECYTKFYKKKNPTHQVLPGVIRRHPPQFLYIIYYFCIKYARILWFANEFL